MAASCFVCMYVCMCTCMYVRMYVFVCKRRREGGTCMCTDVFLPRFPFHFERNSGSAPAALTLLSVCYMYFGIAFENFPPLPPVYFVSPSPAPTFSPELDPRFHSSFMYFSPGIRPSFWGKKMRCTSSPLQVRVAVGGGKPYQFVFIVSGGTLR